MLNVVAIMGRLAADPQLRQTTTGKNVASFRIACDRGRRDANGQSQADWLDVVAWDRTAEFVCKYFQKGSLIAIDRPSAEPQLSGQERQQPHSYRGSCVAGELLRRKGRREARCGRFRPADEKSCARSKHRSQRPAEASERAGVFAGQRRRLFGHRRQRRPPVLSRELRYLAIRARKGGD